ncbi:hypothetical protein [Gimesia panareensis]|uniref:hypothetical protein n=1 Tax=Gimesia panareensis TaxID=2527978 RepID=UPI001187D417|nr:hypothetical protein [Gimesia panareensis]QDU53541.1 hypothetical protein Pan110_59330 [Gimesia panareensis]
MVAKSYISDGYTEKGLIKEVPRLHGPVNFEYRVMLSDKIREVLHSWDLISATEKTRRIHAVIIKQIASWDLEEDGQSLPIDSKTLSRLKRNIVEKLFNIVMQLDLPDEMEPSEELDLDKVLGGDDEDGDGDTKN